MSKHKLTLGLILIGVAVFLYSCSSCGNASENRPAKTAASAPPSKESERELDAAKEKERAYALAPSPYGPVSMGPPPVAHASRMSNPRPRTPINDLTWNVWAEPESPTLSFKPVTFLQPDKPYQLVLDLAALAYRNNPGIFIKAAGDQLKASLQKLVESDAPDTNLTLIIIPDERFFKTTNRAETLRINLDRLRKALKDGLDTPKTPLATLRQNPEADFSFGRKQIELQTLRREGSGSIAIALWADGVPVDELSIPLCVASDAAAARNCKSVNKLHDSLAGIDPVRVAAQQDASTLTPDAALHFIELNPSTQVGIFRDNSWPEGQYESWKLSKNGTATRSELQGILTNFDIATNDSHLLRVGSELYNLLFPEEEDEKKHPGFDNFIAHPREPEDPADPPSIFVRLLTSNNEDPPFLVPLGIMAHEINGKKDFLGFHFRIQTPLQIQDYEPYPKCISSWVVLAPPANASGVPPELNAARERFSAWFDDWEFKPIPEMDQFIDWAQETVSETEPISIFILAHHAGNSLYFEENPRLGPNGIKRRFKTPSVAFVNGCETGAPGTSAIVQRLNNRGVSAVIATAGKVDRLLAGDFFSVLGHYLTAKPAGQEYSLGAAHFLTLKDLRNRKPDENSFPYGAKVLAYEVLGNSSLRICSPPLKPR